MARTISLLGKLMVNFVPFHCTTARQLTSAATLTAKGQIVIPAAIRARYELTPGTQVEFIDEGGVIRLLVRRRVAASDPASGYGLIRVKPSLPGRAVRRLSEFAPASMTLAKSPNSPRKTIK